MEEKEAYIGLNMVKEVGPIRFKILKNYFKSIKKVFEAKEEELLKIPNIGPSIAKNIKNINYSDIEKELEKIRKNNIKILTLEDEDYPINLKAIFDPPPVLYLKGELTRKDILSVAIVGTRNATEYGKYWAKRLAKELVQYDITIVSGLATGIDTYAHIGALNNGGRTIGVLGCGINVVYPPQNKQLMQDILNNGCIISEFPMDTLPNKYNFPRRNRIISGLSLGVVVIEAGTSSGALITANLALEQGREVFALPGQAGSQTAQGTHHLIKQGAKLVESADDILEELENIISLYRKDSSIEEKLEKLELTTEDNFSNKEKLILSLLTTSPIHIEKLSYLTNINIAELNAILLQLEMKGKVEQLLGKRFRKIN